ncbi:MAG: hypothetical protein AAF550_11605, partial [Myxococcota bacterium]
GEDGLLDHGRSVIPANIDVFGLVVSPKYPPGALSNSPVQSQDLFSTLLDAAGLPFPSRPHATVLAEATSSRRGRSTMTVSQPDALWQFASKGLVGGTRYAAVQRGGVRVVLSDPPGSPLVESGTKTSLEASDEVESLLQEARSLMQAARGTLGSAVQLSPAEQEALRALGYLR